MNQRRMQAALDKKLPREGKGSGKENNVWVVVGGKKILRVTYPSGHSGDVKRGIEKAIRQQMKLDAEQFESFVECHMSETDYVQVLRDKGLVLEPSN